jgi:RNA polymerase sigma-70 factor (ECF subfamily)
VALAGITDGLAWGSESKEAALERLMGLHERLVLRTAWRMLGNREDAQDAAQDVFLRLYRHLGNVDEQSVESWLYRTTMNVCYDVLRRRPKTGELLVEPSQASEAANAIEEGEKRSLLEAGLKRLTPQERAAVTLCSIEGLSSAEAAVALGVTEGTVRSHLSLARTRLKEYVGRFWR